MRNIGLHTVFADAMTDMGKLFETEGTAIHRAPSKASGRRPAVRGRFLAFVLAAVLCVPASIAHSAPEEGEAALFPAGAQAAQDENGDAAEMPYDLATGEERILKRRARLHGMRLRTLYGPQAAYHVAFVDAEDEWGSRHTAGATLPLGETWEGAILDHVSYFTLKRGSDSAGRESVSVRAGMNPGRLFRPWLELTPYVNFGDADGQGVGVTAGASNIWRNGALVTAEAFAWRPWDEGYYTIVEDGYKHGAALAFTVPLADRLILAGRAWYEELELGDHAQSGRQHAGRRYDINPRATWVMLRRDGAYMDYGFRDDNLWNEYLVGCELGIFAQVDFQRYYRPSGFNALNPEPKVFAQEAGLSLQYAISPRLGLIAEGYVGRDPDRDLEAGELAGVNGRLVVLANPHLRIWGGASYTKTSTTLEGSGGRETIVSFGIQYAF